MSSSASSATVINTPAPLPVSGELGRNGEENSGNSLSTVITWKLVFVKEAASWEVGK